MNRIVSSLAARENDDERSSQDVLDGILNASREGMLIVDPSMRITAANEPAHEIFARHIGTFVGRRLSEVVRDPGLHEAFRQALSEGTSTDLKVELLATEKRSFDVHVAPLRVSDVSQAIGVFYDITKLERLEKVRQEFLSNISHA